MPNKIQRSFGVTVAVNRDIPKQKYVKLQEELRAELKASNLDHSKVCVYIHHIAIHASEFHLKQGPLSKRMESLTVKLSIGEKARKNKYISFLNHQIKIKHQDLIPVESRNFRMQYTLPGGYCESHKEFDDYVVLLVEPECPDALKQLTMTATARATNQFRTNLINNLTGTAVTKLTFSLSQDIQLTF